MALDVDGKLHIFELKRWQSSPENLLQVLRYGQKFGNYDYSSLEYLFHDFLLKYKPGRKKKTLQEAHREYFELDEPLSHDKFNYEQEFIVITSGVDRQTKDAIDYWNKKGLPVKALPFQIYNTNNDELLFEIASYSPEGDTFTLLPEGLTVVNTNHTYMENAWKEMLDNNKASAYYGRKTSISGVPKRSPIALYHTGVGIIAFGVTTSEYRRKPYGDDPEEEFYLLCDFEFKINPIKEPQKAVKASKINDYLNSSYRFRQTCFTLPKEAIGFIRNSISSKNSN